MRNAIRLTEAGRQYAAAYGAHYTTKDLRKALLLYRTLMATHAKSPEAEYARTQIQNIAHNVVPREELIAAQVDMAFAHLERQGLTGVASAPVAPRTSEVPSQSAVV